MAEARSVDVNIVVMEKPYDGSGDSIVPKVTKVKAPEQANRTDNTLLSSSTSVLLHEAYNYAKQEVTQIASYEINKYFNLHDDYIGQRNLTIAKNVVSKSLGMATAVASGFMVGGPAGGAIALVGVTTSLGIEIYQNYDQENIKLRQMNAQLAYSRQRAGFSLTSESIGENL